MAQKRRSTASWKGSGKDGNGTLSSTSGVLDQTPFSFKTRFENEDGKAGTNPEELIAAAHAGCYTMALSFALGDAGYTPESLNTEATVTIDQVSGGFQIQTIDLDLTAQIPNISEEEFLKLANGAKDNCPVSKALSAVNINLNAKLK